MVWFAMRAVVAVLLFVTSVHAGLWGLLQDKQTAPDFHGMLPSVSYAPFEPGHTVGDIVADSEKVRADLRKLSTLARAVRLYSSTEGNELVPPIAAEFGLKVTVGAWIDKDSNRNAREIEAVINLARRNSNVIGVVVGNETVYRGEQIPMENLGPIAGTGPEPAEVARILGDENQRVADADAQPAEKRAEAMKYAVAANNVYRLARLIQRIKKSVNVPVTTGEIWNIWRDHPQLANSADFIAAHVLPYWENFTDTQAVDQAVAMYRLLREQFPGKRIVIAEFGWPSSGYNLLNAVPGQFEQASVLRNFVARAEAIGMDFNIVEAIDQPWKFSEGGVGPYWGILNAEREPKFAWTGPIVNLDYWKLATIALLVGILMSLPILRLSEPTVMQALVLSAAANGVGAWICDRILLLEHALFRLGVGVRALAWHRAAGAAGADCDGPHRGDRGDRLRPQPAPPDHQAGGGGAGDHRRQRHLPESVDPYPGLLRAGRDAQANARCGVAARLSEFRMRCYHQQHARSGILAADPGPLPRPRRTLRVHQCREGQGV